MVVLVVMRFVVTCVPTRLLRLLLSRRWGAEHTRHNHIVVGGLEQRLEEAAGEGYGVEAAAAGHSDAVDVVDDVHMHRMLTFVLVEVPKYAVQVQVQALAQVLKQEVDCNDIAG